MKEYYLSITNKNYAELITSLEKSLKNNQKEFVITANAEIFMEALNNADLNEILTDKNNIITADGVSIIKTAKYFDIELNKKIAGVELCQTLLDYAIVEELSIFIYGSKEEVLEKLKQKYPKAKFCALKNGYDNKDEEVAKEIINKKPDLIFVALGVPRQERFINGIFKQAKKGVFIGVGGSIDVISGYKKRAPKFFQKHNLEWLYRIIREPKRIKRFVNHNIKLLLIAKKSSKKERKEING